MGRVDIVSISNTYDSIPYFSQRLQEAFTRLGVEARLVSVPEEGAEAVLKAAFRQPPAFICSFNHLSCRDGGCLGDIIGVPHHTYLIGAAFHFLPMTQGKYGILSCVDEQDHHMLEGFGFKRSFFLPHAVEASLQTVPKESQTYEVTFLGSCFDYESIMKQWHCLWPTLACKKIQEAAEEVLYNSAVHHTHRLLQLWKELHPAEERTALFDFAFQFELYIRGRARHELLRSITSVPLHVFGDVLGYKGWSHYLAKQTNVTLHPAVNYAQGLEVMRRSKICLNSVPSFRYGSHERLFTVPACHSLLVTEETPYIQRTFHVSNELLTYTLPKHQLNELLDAYLADDQKRLQMIEAARERVFAAHTFDHRACSILDYMQPYLG